MAKFYQTQNALNMAVSSCNPQKLSIAYSDKQCKPCQVLNLKQINKIYIFT